MGIISTGCALCRQRRVKCDEAKPGCSRCAKIDKPCPGYERGLKVVFYAENGEIRKKKAASAANAKTKDVDSPKPAASLPTRQRARKHIDPIPQSVPSSTVDPLLGPRTSAQGRAQVIRGNALNDGRAEYVDEPTLSFVHPSLTTDIEVRSVCLFVSSFVHDARSNARNPAFLDFLPKLYASASPDSCLHRTLNAVAQLNFLNRYKASTALSEWAKHSYGQALRATNAALSNRQLAATDHTLTSVWLLSMYELLVPNDLAIGQRTPWVNHVSGTLQLLRMRGTGQVSTHIGRQLFQLVHFPIVAMNMMLGGRPSQGIGLLNKAMLECDKEDSMGSFLLSDYIQRVADVRSSLKVWIEAYFMRNGQDTNLTSLKMTILEGSNILVEGGFETWAAKNSEWQPDLTSSEILSLLDIPTLGRHFFKSSFVMYHWLTAWTTKILLLQSLLNGLLLLQNANEGLDLDVSQISSRDASPFEVIVEPDITKLKSQLCDTVDSILGSILFAFGELDIDGQVSSSPMSSSSAYNSSAIGAFHMFWPAGAVLACPYTTIEQKLLARSALQAIGERFCVVQALKYCNL